MSHFFETLTPAANDDDDRYEVDLDEKIGKIGIGYFSSVYKGTWRKRTVAIKILASTTPRKLFKREIRIWKKLSHPNVIELYGASSASGDPPWFFVCPYYKNGSLVTWLKAMKNADDVDMLRSLHQIAKGMEYLHKKEVLHGDLKVRSVSQFKFIYRSDELFDSGRQCAGGR